MADILWDLVAIRDYVGIFITWLFVIAFLYNLSASINSPYKNTMYLSGIMMILRFGTAVVAQFLTHFIILFLV